MRRKIEDHNVILFLYQVSDFLDNAGTERNELIVGLNVDHLEVPREQMEVWCDRYGSNGIRYLIMQHFF